MFQEPIGKLTAEHLREHITGYLADIEAEHTGQDAIKLQVPTISDKTLVGGVMAADIDELPLMGVDCVEKQEIPSGESLYFYQYDGAIVGLIRGPDSSVTDRMVKRYAGAAERYVRDHLYLHRADLDLVTEPFSIREFVYLKTSFSGSMEVQLEEQRLVWIAGFTCEVSWFTSEDAPRQH